MTPAIAATAIIAALGFALFALILARRLDYAMRRLSRAETSEEWLRAELAISQRDAKALRKQIADSERWEAAKAASWTN